VLVARASTVVCGRLDPQSRVKSAGLRAVTGAPELPVDEAFAAEVDGNCLSPHRAHDQRDLYVQVPQRVHDAWGEPRLDDVQTGCRPAGRNRNEPRVDEYRTSLLSYINEREFCRSAPRTRLSTSPARRRCLTLRHKVAKTVGNLRQKPPLVLASHGSPRITGDTNDFDSRACSATSCGVGRRPTAR
jgi:hypothetical protein